MAFPPIPRRWNSLLYSLSPSEKSRLWKAARKRTGYWRFYVAVFVLLLICCITFAILYDLNTAHRLRHPILTYAFTCFPLGAVNLWLEISRMRLLKKT